MEKEKDLEDLLQDLANYKVQLEAKDSAYKQALLKLDHYEKTVDELSTLLKKSELEREIYINECREARSCVDELESQMELTANQLSETEKSREQLSHVISELKATQGELLNTEMELVAATEAKLEAMTQAELAETALNMVKVNIEELLKQVSDLNETILHLKLASIEADNEKCAVVAEKEDELQLANEKVEEAQEEMQYLREQLEMIKGLESQLLAKSIFIDSLQLELQQANELHGLAEKAASDAISDMNRLKQDLELQEKENLDQAGYIDSLEMELNQLRLELNTANKDMHRLNCKVEIVTGELDQTKSEMDEIRQRENEAQVEIALLKAELHKERSKTAAAEAAEVRAKSEKSAVYVALQKLALEADEAKKETRRIKSETSASDGEAEEIRDDTSARVTISTEEYDVLVKKAEMADNIQEPTPENWSEFENLKRELESATVKIGEFRTRAEQAVTRAEVAEFGKAALEAQIQRWREHKERRKAASVALREESISRENYSFKYDDDDASKTYQPLSKLLKMDSQYG